MLRLERKDNDTWYACCQGPATPISGCTFNAMPGVKGEFSFVFLLCYIFTRGFSE